MPIAREYTMVITDSVRPTTEVACFADMAYKENINHRKHALHTHFKHHRYCKQDHSTPNTAGGIVLHLTLQRLADKRKERIDTGR